MLRPTAERVASLGGLHKFMNWNGPILTDSGGFQVMSLTDLRWKSRSCSAPTSLCVSTNAPPCQRIENASKRAWKCRCAGRNAPEGIEFDGYAIGGLAVGEGQEAMFNVLDFAPNQLPVDKPRYLMGVGKPDDLVGAVQRGVDMFDCVLPSRSGRTGQALTRMGAVNIKNARHQDDPRPLTNSK